jgi:phage terminase large subunit-like protein
MPRSPSSTKPSPKPPLAGLPSGFEINWDELAKLPESEQALFHKKLAAAQRHIERNPLEAYVPHRKQILFHSSKARWRLFLGGNRSGKTTASLADDIIQAVDEDCLPDHLKPYKRWTPPFACRIVAPKFNESHVRVTFPKLRELLPRDQLLGGSWDKAFSKQERVLSFKNGSWFQFMTFEQDLDAFMGAKLERIHFDEEPQDFEMFRVNRQRLIDTEGDFILSMTPENGLSWSYERFWEPVEAHETEQGVYASEDIGIVQVDIRENPHLNPKEIALVSEGLTQEEQAALLSGRFIHLQGLVYGEFRDETHVIDPIDSSFLKDKTVVVTVDPGLRRAGVLFTAYDDDNDMVAFDELYPTEPDSLPENLVKAIRRREKFWGITGAQYLIDPAVRIRSLQNAESLQSAFIQAGLPAMPAQNDLEAGVFEVKRRLQHGGLLITRNCQNLLWERKRYRIKPTDDGSFQDVNRDNHLVDCLRYSALSRPWRTQDQPKVEESHWVPGTAPAYEWFQQIQTPSPPLGSMT